METITQPKSGSKFPSGMLLSKGIRSIVFICISSTALAEPPSAATAYATPAATIAIASGKVGTAPSTEDRAEVRSASTGSTTAGQVQKERHDDEIDFPRPGVSLTLLVVLLLMAFIGKRRSG